MFSPNLLLPLAVLPTLALSQNFLFSFGSSYTETGFSIQGRQPSAKYPLGNPAYGTASDPTKPNVHGTAGGGPNYIDHLVTTYNCSLVMSYNFAVGGTVVATDVVHGSSPDLRHQVSDSFGKNYGKMGKTEAPWDAENSLFLVFMGDNDVQGSYKIPGGTPVGKLMDAYFKSIEELYNHGARRFLLVKVPPLDRSPSHNASREPAADKAKLTKVIKEYNEGLATGAEDFKVKHKSAHVEIYEFNQFLTGVLDNPKPFGFESADCEGDGASKCIWWKPSDGHTTSRFQDLMARDMAEGVMRKFGW